MNKAILVIDMPHNCYACPCFDGADGSSMCNVLMEDVMIGANKYKKPKDCPLKSLPQYKKSLCLTDNNSIMISQPRIYESGWNACLDEILWLGEE